MRKAPVDYIARYASPVVAARQPGKEKRRVCGDYRIVNSLCHTYAWPTKNVKEVTT